MFLVVHDSTPDPRRTSTAPSPPRGAFLDSSAALPAAAVRVTASPGGVRLSFTPWAGPSHVGVPVAALAAVVGRERRAGGFLRFAVDVDPDGAAVNLTITGPAALRRRPT